MNLEEYFEKSEVLEAAIRNSKKDFVTPENLIEYVQTLFENGSFTEEEKIKILSAHPRSFIMKYFVNR